MKEINSDHHLGFDYLRAIAAFAVVWIHGCDTSPILKKSGHFLPFFAVPVFLLLSAFLVQKSIEKNDTCNIWSFIIKKLKRLAPSFLVWTVIYIIVRILKRQLLNQGLPDLDPISLIFMGGASYQLYYIPMLFYTIVIFSPLLILTRKFTIKTKVFISTLIGISLLVLSTFPAPFYAPPSYALFNHWYGNIGYFLIGAGALYSISLKPGTQKLLLYLTIIVFVISLCKLFKPNVSLIIYSIGIFCFFLYFPFKTIPKLIKRLSICSLGIYLSHGLFIESFQVVAHKLSIDMTKPIVTVSIIVSSFIVSYILCEFILKSERLKWTIS